LFRAYFIDAQFVGDVDTLCELAAECALDREAVRAFLTDPSELAKIAARDKDIRRQGISGVPFFIFNNRQAVSGAQPPRVLQQAIEQSTA
jgi:predicted DsbA family dithiol-disulfide isomerase